MAIINGSKLTKADAGKVTTKSTKPTKADAGKTAKKTTAAKKAKPKK